MAAGIGLPADLDVHVTVDETSPFGHTKTALRGQRVDLMVDGGAFEDPQRLRRLSEPVTRQVLGRLLYRVADRLDPAFGAPPPDEELTLPEFAAWDTYAVGRYACLAAGRGWGRDAGQARRRYSFRLRHGFTDAADLAFDRLWLGQGLTWDEVRASPYRRR